MAAKTFYYRTYKSKFQNIPEVITHMEKLQEELQDTELANVGYFNKTYTIITVNVHAKNEHGYFTHKDALNALDINFAKYYFNSLKAYVDGKRTTPAWKKMFDFCKKNNSLPIIYVGLGVNAHVNNDLGLSLHDTLDKEHFKKDYNKVNKIISDSLDEVITEVGLSKMYKPFMDILIKHWRKNAWNSYKRMNHFGGNKQIIEIEAEEIAKAFTHIHTMKDFYHLYKVI